MIYYHNYLRRILISATILILLAGWVPSSMAADRLGDHVILSWNDLGMHCMNKDHQNISILPPYNNLWAQVIQRGDELTLPSLVTQDVTVEYSIPGNTYSVGKTDFWDYAYKLFGVNLPDDIGLTGKGLNDVMDPHGTHFSAEGITLTPFTDADPTNEDPYQQALVIARDLQGVELARSEPVIPVSTEVGCVSASCHSSESSLLNMHEEEGGFNPNNTPILCASCHADPALGTQGIPDADYFSKAIHSAHKFIDELYSGIDGCYKCHPGEETGCLRGTMANDYNMICQDCHGDMDHVQQTISNGRTPWVDEPSCRECHTATYGEPAGQLFRNSTGHGGVMCSACHGSPHAIYPSREARDNANNITLQGHAGILSDCTVCHGHVPAGPGPHGLISSDVTASELTGSVRSLQVHPSPMRFSCTIEFAADNAESGRLLVFDAQGRTLRMLRPVAKGNGIFNATWDGIGRAGRRVSPGVYFIRWENGTQSAAGKVTVTG
ncbi:MAG: hypothetical protein KJ927_12250 [Candidatus Eisenbacteria bacterium]|nr:hypothetical protein [Candidatus Eisenbacteria bacterium]